MSDKVADAVSDRRFTVGIAGKTCPVSPEKTGCTHARVRIYKLNPGSGTRNLDILVGGMVVWDAAQSQPLRRPEIELY